jgi:hypothetical protein
MQRCRPAKKSDACSNHKSKPPCEIADRVAPCLPRRSRADNLAAIGMRTTRLISMTVESLEILQIRE